uniref:EGF-like domain-containing protein n=1 Tax=Scleropages formosus TaxID=113540 RepID=A0A8C9VRZ2_SCLFO
MAICIGNPANPHALMLGSPCTGEIENFCMNGVCSYNLELNTPSCRCLPNFTGERCQHILLDSHSKESPEKLIAIGVGVALLLICLAGVLICCAKKRYSKSIFAPVALQGICGLWLS